jgi:homocitrate synthase NifV
MDHLTDCLLAWEGMERCEIRTLKEIYELLLTVGVSRAEMSGAVYDKLRAVTDLGLSRGLDAAQDVRSYAAPDESLDVCLDESSGTAPDADCLSVIRAERWEDIPWDRLDAPGMTRLILWDRLFFQEYPRLFSRLLPYADRLELCPLDRNGLAGAAAAEWLRHGGKRAVVSYLGKGDLAPLETVVMALCLRGRGKGFDPSPLTRLRELCERAVGVTEADRRPVVGRRIFHVESGVHVDGILKNPVCYEPFPPETVGGRRLIRLGKHSGMANIRYALQARGFCSLGAESETSLLERVRAESVRLGRGLSEEEFDAILDQDEQMTGRSGGHKRMFA